MLAHETNQTLFAEFAKVIFRLGNAVAEGQENVSALQFDGTFLERHIIKKADHGTATIKSPEHPVTADNHRREVAGVGVSQQTRAAVVRSEEERGVFFGRRAVVELFV